MLSSDNRPRIMKPHPALQDLPETHSAGSENGRPAITQPCKTERTSGSLSSVYYNIELLGYLAKAAQAIMQRLDVQIKFANRCEDAQGGKPDNTPFGGSPPADLPPMMDVLKILRNLEISSATHELACLGPEIRVLLENLTQELQAARQALRCLANRMSKE